MAVVIGVETFKMGKFGFLWGYGLDRITFTLEIYLNIHTREKIMFSLGHCRGRFLAFSFTRTGRHLIEKSSECRGQQYSTGRVL